MNQLTSIGSPTWLYLAPREGMTPRFFRGWLCAVAASTLGAVALSALADEGAATPDWHRDPRAVNAAEPVTNWYGWQLLVTDGASVAVFTAGASAGSTSPVMVRLAGYLVGAPIVHLAHGRPGAAAGSLGLRALLPILGVYVGAAVLPPTAVNAAISASPLARSSASV